MTTTTETAPDEAGLADAAQLAAAMLNIGENDSLKLRSADAEFFHFSGDDRRSELTLSIAFVRQLRAAGRLP